MRAYNMDLRVLNASFVMQGILDDVESFIWTEKYYEYGEFEIYVNFSPYFFDLLKKDYYIVNSDSSRVMIIESIEIKSNPETGNKLVVKGRSLESILDRRIILRQIILDGSLQDGVGIILDKEVIDGIFPERNFPNFIFTPSTDPLVTTPTLKSQYYMDNLYDVIRSICEESGLGFKITLTPTNQFNFELYSGSDRSYTQVLNPYIVFSPNFDNLIKSDYLTSGRYRKTYVFVAGVGGLEAWNQNFYGPWAQAFTGVETGLDRREMFLDASYIPKTYEDTGIEIPDADYVDQLHQRGVEELSRNIDFTVFDAQIDLSRTYEYGSDFFLGDIIQYVDEYGHVGRTRITEMTFSVNLSGNTIYPTLKMV
jgi:hypothetical protein